MMSMYHLVIKNMKECVECGKKLGLIEGYRHPTMGKEYLLCSSCFDTVFTSVEQWRSVITTYTGFFTKETAPYETLQKKWSHLLESAQKKVEGLRSHTISPDDQEKRVSIH